MVVGCAIGGKHADLSAYQPVTIGWIIAISSPAGDRVRHRRVLPDPKVLILRLIAGLAIVASALD